MDFWSGVDDVIYAHGSFVVSGVVGEKEKEYVVWHPIISLSARIEFFVVVFVFLFASAAFCVRHYHRVGNRDNFYYPDFPKHFKTRGDVTASLYCVGEFCRFS
ncbi:hypothetical protein A2Z00_01430 [Candidatus Gottesmanbacteria bacterium RBG_13_45_10]|uniref:Guanylate cyclase domain-containing protein n=1 Tax=Candidatus Gottesmanbacteria bacterium RBG_13_45_10 TaxID=1798370 RepID=A0A1F5ZHF8_9BACT|nr:MAG: hypothetical protein A2Z00_01430 [Candidatus Gottesmanbacteria bacterium RBG_13_45_10]